LARIPTHKPAAEGCISWAADLSVEAAQNDGGPEYGPKVFRSSIAVASNPRRGAAAAIEDKIGSPRRNKGRTAAAWFTLDSTPEKANMFLQNLATDEHG